MKRTLTAFALLLAMGTLARTEPAPEALTPFDPDKPLTEQDKGNRLKRVQPNTSSPEQVRRLLGPPTHTARQILYQRAREQWVYEAPFSVRVEWEYVRGQEPHLLSVQPTGPNKP
jgi:hypothetical protein